MLWSIVSKGPEDSATYNKDGFQPVQLASIRVGAAPIRPTNDVNFIAHSF